MAFLPLLEESLPTLFNAVTATEAGGASILNNYANSQYALGLSEQNSAQSLDYLRAATDAASDRQDSGQTFIAGQNSENRAFQTNLFNQSQTNASNMQQNYLSNMLTMQQNSFQNSAQLQSNSIKAGFGQSALQMGSSLLGGVANGITSSLLMNQQASLQRQNFDYMTGKAQDAYTQAGLPSWLAFSPSSMSMLPRSSQVVSGNNFFNSQLPGNPTATPWTGSDSQVTFGVGNIPTAQ